MTELEHYKRILLPRIKKLIPAEQFIPMPPYEYHLRVVGGGDEPSFFWLQRMPPIRDDDKTMAGIYGMLVCEKWFLLEAMAIAECSGGVLTFRKDKHHGNEDRWTLGIEIFAGQAKSVTEQEALEDSWWVVEPSYLSGLVTISEVAKQKGMTWTQG